MKTNKKIRIYIIAVIIVLASSPLIYWAVQNQLSAAQNPGVEYNGHHEQQQDYIRFWTNIQPDGWSGMATSQKWSFTPTLWLKAQVTVTSLGSPTFYTEVIMVSSGQSEVDEGFGFQITYNSTDTVRIKGWSWVEEDESFSTYIDKPVNELMNLDARKISASQIDYYVDGILLGSITAPIPTQEGIMDFDMTNGAQGGYAEVLFNYQIQQ